MYTLEEITEQKRKLVEWGRGRKKRRNRGRRERKGRKETEGRKRSETGRTVFAVHWVLYKKEVYCIDLVLLRYP